MTNVIYMLFISFQGFKSLNCKNTVAC